MNNKVNYWKEMSDYDLDTADAMLRTGRYLYVGFMSHQAIEKILKAYFVRYKNSTAPFSHSLSLLAKEADLFEHFSEDQRDFLDLLEPLNIETRYPTNKDSLINSLTKDRCISILEQTKELQKWIKAKL